MIDIVIYIGTVQGVILSLILLTTRRGNIPANHILGIKILLFTFIIFSFLFRPGALTDICFLCIVIQNIFLIISPLIYLYTITLTDPETKIRPRCLLYFIPLFLSIAAYLIFYYLILGNDKNPTDRTAHLGNFSQTINYAVILVMMLFLILSFISIKQYKIRIKNIFSNLQSINLRWLQFVLAAYTIIIIIIAFMQFLKNGYYSWGMVCILLSFFIYFMGYMGLRQPEIFSGFIPSAIENYNNKKKYEKSTLTDDKGEDYLNKLLELIEKDKIYLENELNLPALASRLNLSPHHLSQIINERLNKNFFDFINNYRVKESKRMLSDKKYDHFNILAIGLEAGFNSNTTFISAFKRHEKMTPSNYRKMRQS
jgi:AraC-like DNA-binding protein